MKELISILLFNTFLVLAIICLCEPEYSNRKLLRISKSLKKKYPEVFKKTEDGVTSIEINNQHDFEKVWLQLMSKIDYCNKKWDVERLYLWCIVAIQHFTEYIIEYGSSLDRKTLIEFIKLLKKDGII